MIKQITLILNPEQLFNKAIIKKEISKKLSLPSDQINDYKIIRKSIDARKKVKYNLQILVATKGKKFYDENISFNFINVKNKKNVLIAGAGPAGYFAALNCLMNGLKPIIIERGKPVEERKFDIALINKGESVDPDSNFAFGEGGAGTYSDGKLYTRIKKRGDVEKILKLLVYFGADKNILIDSHPHIGTDRLSGIITNIRNKIIECGGEIHFNQKITELIIKSSSIYGVKTHTGDSFESDKLILATGHSARDIYYMLKNQNVETVAKGFAMGVRVEHPQELIDSIQYKRASRGKYLPPATYSLVKQVNGRGVYSFCMCPGGNIVPAATSENEIVVNGMSNSRRNSSFANSGLVVELRPNDLQGHENTDFAGIEFQKQLEKLAFINGGRGLTAPAQRVDDFINSKVSSDLPDCSYFPGIVSSPLHFWLPEIIGENLKLAIRGFDKIMKGFITKEAVVVGVESRTSSPVQICRDNKTGEHISIKGLYPCGEGAGYAGGIVSAAIDGMFVSQSIFKDLFNVSSM